MQDVNKQMQGPSLDLRLQKQTHTVAASCFVISVPSLWRQRLWSPEHHSFPVSWSVSSHKNVPPATSTSLVQRVHQQTKKKAIRHLDPTLFEVSVSASFPCTPVLNPSWTPGLMVVTNGQHQRNEAAQHQSSHLHLAQSFAPVSPVGGVAVAATAYLREDVDGGHVEEGAGGEEHGDTSGVDVWQGLLAALRGEQTETLWGHMCGYECVPPRNASRLMARLFTTAGSHQKNHSKILTVTWLRPKKVSMARTGAASAKTRRCLRMRFLSRPACIRNDTRPNAAGACRRQGSRVH